MTAVSDFLTNLFSTLFKDEAGVLQPVADTYLTGIVANPAPDNVVAQSIAYQAQAIAVLPDVEATAAKDAAMALKAFIDAQVPSLVAQASADVAGALATNPTSASSEAPQASPSTAS